MSFHNWYSKSITEAQDRYKKEEKEVQANIKADEAQDRPTYTFPGLNGMINKKEEKETFVEDDLLRFEDDGGWHGI